MLISDLHLTDGSTAINVASAFKLLDEETAASCKSRGAATISPAVDQAIQRAMAKEPADRFSTVGEFVRVLAAAS